MKRCYNGGNKHKFKPRYDEQPRGGWAEEIYNIEDARKLLTYRIYVKDICTWCGKEIKK